ncbi:hypothetical protein M0R72_11030 [Candidatus Pacearchaeota archaeon]|jgi:hypothetical protein|nr:hypothetical protein [Candidatus Pacearchaeota archaeon]
MSILPPGLGEIVALRHRSSIDQYGDPTYTDSSISVIWFDQKRVVHREGREDVLCDAFCLTEDATVQENDALTRGGTTWPVLDVATTTGYFGMSLRVVNLSKNQA